MSIVVTVEGTGPVNIAVVKYWGKSDEQLVIPINSSLSGTINQQSMRSFTRIQASKRDGEHSMTLNGKPVNLVDTKISTTRRLQVVMRESLARCEDYVVDGNIIVSKDDWKNYKLTITSENDFPTAAGLASSASGLACFTKVLCSLYNVQGDISTIARQGSGSACRSIYGGWVEWQKGKTFEGHDSKAVQICDENHWSDMRVVILVANSGAKETPSTSGMKTSVMTSKLLAKRAEDLVDGLGGSMEIMRKAIREKDFASFAEATMKESNQFHACCLDTYPPIFYLNSTSHKIIQLVHTFNNEQIRAAYTFDAGPNAVIYIPNQYLEEFLQVCKYYFHNGGMVLEDKLDLTKDMKINDMNEVGDIAKQVIDVCGDADENSWKVSKAIVTNIGPGATIISHTYTSS